MRIGSMSFCVEKLHALAAGDAHFWTLLSASYAARMNCGGVYFFLGVIIAL